MIEPTPAGAHRARVALSAAFFVLATAASAEIVARGPAFQVNSQTHLAQSFPQAAFQPGERFLIVWDSASSTGDDSDGKSIQGRLFAPDGAPLGEDFQINATTAGGQEQPRVAALLNGDFLVVWRHSMESVRGRRVSGTGAPVGDDFEVGSVFPGGRITGLDIAVSPTAGGAIVTWSETAQGLVPVGAVTAVRLAADGTALGEPSTITDAEAFDVRVAPRSSNGFLVAWIERDLIAASDLLKARWVSDDGTLAGEERTLTGDIPALPFHRVHHAIHVDPDGKFWAVWVDGAPRLVVQRFLAGGAPDGDPIHRTVGDNPREPRLLSLGSELLLVWTVDRFVGSSQSTELIGQLITADGRVGGPWFPVDPEGSAFQLRADSAVSPSGRVVVAWESAFGTGSDQSRSGIEARRYLNTVACGDTRPGEVCVGRGRFKVEASWTTLDGATGGAEGFLVTENTAVFTFFDDANVELVVKVLDACALTDRFWVFAAGLTDVEVELVVTDTFFGTSRTYTNPLSSPFQPIQDTSAFATCP